MSGSVSIIVEVAAEEIGKEEKFQNGKHNEQLDQDNNPERTSYRHLPETGNVKVHHGPYQASGFSR